MESHEEEAKAPGKALVAGLAEWYPGHDKTAVPEGDI